MTDPATSHRGGSRERLARYRKAKAEYDPSHRGERVKLYVCPECGSASSTERFCALHHDQVMRDRGEARDFLPASSFLELAEELDGLAAESRRECEGKDSHDPHYAYKLGLAGGWGGAAKALREHAGEQD